MRTATHTRPHEEMRRDGRTIESPRDPSSMHRLRMRPVSVPGLQQEIGARGATYGWGRPARWWLLSLLSFAAGRQEASRFLREVERGETIEVTDRGRPVALLVSVPSVDRIEGLLASGRLVPAAGDLLELGQPLEPLRGAPLPSEASPRPASMSAEPTVYLDSSALVKLVVHEPESGALGRYLRRRPRRMSCALARVEVVLAVRLQGAVALTRARRVLERLSLLRLDDSLLDAAQTIGVELESVVTYDIRMTAAAIGLGLRIASPS